MANRAPALVEAVAQQRADARAARDWAAADRLRAQIEAAGWKVIDDGISYRLEPAPTDIEVGGETRYGRSDAVAPPRPRLLQGKRGDETHARAVLDSRLEEFRKLIEIFGGEVVRPTFRDVRAGHLQ